MVNTENVPKASAPSAPSAPPSLQDGKSQADLISGITGAHRRRITVVDGKDDNSSALVEPEGDTEPCTPVDTDVDDVKMSNASEAERAQATVPGPLVSQSSGGLPQNWAEKFRYVADTYTYTAAITGQPDGNLSSIKPPHPRDLIRPKTPSHSALADHQVWLVGTTVGICSIWYTFNPDMPIPNIHGFRSWDDARWFYARAWEVDVVRLIKPYPDSDYEDGSYRPKTGCGPNRKLPSRKHIPRPKVRSLSEQGDRTPPDLEYYLKISEATKKMLAGPPYTTAAPAGVAGSSTQVTAVPKIATPAPSVSHPSSNDKGKSVALTRTRVPRQRVVTVSSEDEELAPPKAKVAKKAAKKAKVVKKIPSAK